MCCNICIVTNMFGCNGVVEFFFVYHICLLLGRCVMCCGTRGVTRCVAMHEICNMCLLLGRDSMQH